MKLFVFSALLSVALLYTAPIVSQWVMTHDAGLPSQTQAQHSHMHASAEQSGMQAVRDDNSLLHHWCGYCKLLSHLSWYSQSDASLSVADAVNTLHILFPYAVNVNRWVLDHLQSRAPPFFSA
ncbi:MULTISPECIES: DUF2946 domain-containing protein [unclassified Vibrio]|uniref:DUF2946 domain-containing protein n=1 Tax=unclassified Vibrio TaxID=2614977 RepID=UPI001455ED9E|nr:MULTISPECIES: DUF2946 domain-containing protein [unclassified Vibrio]